MPAAAKKTTTSPRRVRVPKKPATSMQSESASVASLHAYIPSPTIAEEYVGRKIHGVHDILLALHAKRTAQNMLLMGDTGSGKTLFGEALGSKEQCLYYSLPCDVSIDPSALFGKMVTTEQAGVFRWQDGPVTQIVRGPCGNGGNCKDPKCKGGILNISEGNFMTPKVAASLYPLLDHRRYLPLLGHEGEIVTCHPNTLIIMDYNPKYRGTIEINAAFKNRFPLKITWNYSEDVEERLVRFSTLRTIAKKLRDMRGTDINTPVSTNMLMEFEKFATTEGLGLEFAIGNFVSAFDPTEQKSIQDVFTLNESKLKSEAAWELKKKKLGKDAPEEEEDVDDDDLEEMDFEFEAE